VKYSSLDPILLTSYAASTLHSKMDFLSKGEPQTCINW